MVEDEDIEGGLWKFLDTWKRGSENFYTSNLTGVGVKAPKKLNH